MIWLATTLGALKSAFTSLLGIVSRHPWQCAVVASLCLAAWFWHGRNSERDAKESALAQVAEIVKASEEAGRLALAAKQATEQRYRNLANAIDTEHKAQLADARGATSAYIASHRVPKAAGCSPSPATSTADHSDAGVSASVPADVIVGEADVRACGDLYAYSVNAYNWAKGLAD